MASIKRFLAVLGVLMIAAAAVLVPASSAHAQDNGRWSIFPKTAKGNDISPRQYFILDARPGQVIKDSVTLKNATVQPLQLDVYAADAFNTTAGGAFALKKQDETMTDVGSWLKLPTDTVTIPAAKKNKKGVLVAGKLDVPFTITVPDTATPGDHAGGVVSIDAVPQFQDPTTGGATQIKVRQANAVRTYIRVAGPLSPTLLITDVHFTSIKPGALPFVASKGSGKVEFRVVNSGNVRLTPDGSLALKGLFGRTITKIDPLLLPELLPGQSAIYSQSLDKMPSLDRVDARLELGATGVPGVSAAGDAVAWSISWLFVIVLVLILVALGLYLRYRRRGERAAPDAPAGRRRAQTGAVGAGGASPR